MHIDKIAKKYLSLHFPDMGEIDASESRKYGLQAQIGACDIFLEKKIDSAEMVIQELALNFEIEYKRAAKVLKHVLNLVSTWRKELFNELSDLIEIDIKQANELGFMGMSREKDLKILFIRENMTGKITSDIEGLASYLKRNSIRLKEAKEKLSNPPDFLNSDIDFHDMDLDQLLDCAMILLNHEAKVASGDIEILGF